MKLYPTATWTTAECTLCVLAIDKLLPAETCHKIAGICIGYMDHAKVMAYFPPENLTPEIEMVLAKAVEGYIRENRRRSANPGKSNRPQNN